MQHKHVKSNNFSRSGSLKRQYSQTVYVAESLSVYSVLSNAALKARELYIFTCQVIVNQMDSKS